jgi:hypothetical protein
LSLREALKTFGAVAFNAAKLGDLTAIAINADDGEWSLFSVSRVVDGGASFVKLLLAEVFFTFRGLPLITALASKSISIVSELIGEWKRATHFSGRMMFLRLY